MPGHASGGENRSNGTREPKTVGNKRHSQSPEISSEVTRSSFPPPHPADTAWGRWATEKAPLYRPANPSPDTWHRRTTGSPHDKPATPPRPPGRGAHTTADPTRPARDEGEHTRAHPGGALAPTAPSGCSLRECPPPPNPPRLRGRTGHPRQPGRHPAGEHRQAAESGHPTGPVTSPIHSCRIAARQGCQIDPRHRHRPLPPCPGDGLVNSRSPASGAATSAPGSLDPSPVSPRGTSDHCDSSVGTSFATGSRPPGWRASELPAHRGPVTGG
ncbi:hypothetical protein C8K36_108228 [Rhodococcus sp. OK519]|nr:hypothetical protein C8K36_108228 [Rhodococcus sp. OK519]